MIKTEDIRTLVEEVIAGTDMFVVEVIVRPDSSIEVSLDSESGVGIDDCVMVSRFIEEKLDRDVEDFELMVASAGLSEPLKVFRQYEKNLGKEVEVLLKNGQKLKGVMTAVTENDITITYEVKELVEGKKRKQTVVKTERYALADIKYTKLVVHVK